VQWVDYNRDGGLDLSIDRGYTSRGGHFLFKNLLPDVVRQRSLSVAVLDANGHQTRFGSEVRVFDASGRIVATRLVPAGGGYDTQSAAPAHFGLASPSPVTIEVTFMSRKGRQKQTVRNISPADYRGRSLVIRQQK